MSGNVLVEPAYGCPEWFKWATVIKKQKEDEDQRLLARRDREWRTRREEPTKTRDDRTTRDDRITQTHSVAKKNPFILSDFQSTNIQKPALEKVISQSPAPVTLTQGAWKTTLKHRSAIAYYQDEKDILKHSYYNGKPKEIILSHDNTAGLSPAEYIRQIQDPKCTSVCTSFRSCDGDVAWVLGMVWDIDVDFEGDKEEKTEIARFLRHETPTLEELFRKAPKYADVWHTKVVPLMQACDAEGLLYKLASSGNKGWSMFIKDPRLFLRLLCHDGKYDTSLIVPAIKSLIGSTACDQIDASIYSNNGQIRPNLFHHPVTHLWPVIMNRDTDIKTCLYGTRQPDPQVQQEIASMWTWIIQHLPTGNEGTDVASLGISTPSRKRKREGETVGLTTDLADLTHADQQWIQTCVSHLKDKGHDVQGTRVRGGNVFIAVGKNETDRLCPNTGKSHTSNNQGFRVDLLRRNLVRFCYDAECNTSRTMLSEDLVSGSSTLPDEITHQEEMTTVAPVTPPNTEPLSFDVLRASPWVKYWTEGVDQVTFGKIVADVLKGGPITCVDCEKKQWYFFDAHRWHDDPGKRRTTGWIHDTLQRKAHAFMKKLIDVREDSLKNHVRTKQLDEWEKNIKTMLDRTRSVRGERALIDNLSRRLCDESFVSERDQNPHLLGFDNGVWDLREHCLRDGRAEDKITKSCGYDFPLDDPEEDADFVEFFRVLRNAVREDDQWEYLARFLASCFELGNKEEHLNIWIGEGGNCKGMVSSLLSNMLGDYFAPLGSGFLAEKKSDPNVADPVMLSLQGKRVVTIDEPSGKNIDVPMMLRITGDVKTPTRALYSNVIVDVKPSFKPILITNKIPAIPLERTQERALQRRIFIFDWKVNFFGSEDEIGYDASNPQHALGMDKDVLKNLLEKATPFFTKWLLKTWHPHYLDTGLHIPQSVRMRSHLFIRDQDPLQQWFEEERFQKTTVVCHVTPREVWTDFCTWWGKRRSRPKRAEVLKYVDDRTPMGKDLTCVDKKRHVNGYVGWKLSEG